MAKSAHPAHPAPARAWQRMLSGRRLDLLDPSPLDIEIADIAHGLARVARWNGQTHGEHALSVAQHAVLVEAIAVARNPGWPRMWRLAALLHDAPEYVIGDLISPFKTAIGLDYKAFEERLLSAVHRRFGLPVVLPDAVVAELKAADRISAYQEAIDLAGFDPTEAAAIFTLPARFDPRAPRTRTTALSAPAAQAAFLDRFKTLASP